MPEATGGVLLLLCFGLLPSLALQFPLTFSAWNGTGLLVGRQGEVLLGVLITGNNVTGREVILGSADSPLVQATGDTFTVTSRIDSGLKIDVVSTEGNIVETKLIPATTTSHLFFTKTQTNSFLLLWDSLSADSDSYGIACCLLSPSLDPLKCNFRVNGFTQGSQTRPCGTVIPSGFLTVWASSGPKTGLVAQLLDSTGNRIGSEVEISTKSDFAQCKFAENSVNVLVIHRDNPITQESQLYIQRFTDDGWPIGPFQLVSWHVIVHISSIFALELSDSSVLLAVNSMESGIGKSFLLRVSDFGCVYWWKPLKSLPIESISVLEVMLTGEHSAEIAIFSLTFGLFRRESYDWEIGSMCQKAETSLSVSWERIPIAPKESPLPLVGILIPTIGSVLLLTLIFVLIRAWFKRRKRIERMKPMRIGSTSESKHMDSISPLHFSEKRFESPFDASLDMADIIADVQGTDSSPVKSPTLGRATTD